MALNYTLNTDTVLWPGPNGVTNSMEVRGLTVPDITQLVDVHQGAALSVYNRFTGKDPSIGLTEQTVETIALDLLGKFPSVVAHVLALSGDEPERIEDYARLPIDVQVAALEKVAILTFAMQGGLKNFVETVARIAASAGGLTETLRHPQN